MVSQKVTIKNPTGLHLRPAGILCKGQLSPKRLLNLPKIRLQKYCDAITN